MMMRLLRLLLFPFAVLYGWVTALRNRLYDWGWLPSHSFAVPVLAVGNLTVGGTGKTPHVEYLLRLLAPRQRATLSRGYGRETKGFRLAGPTDSGMTIGDEPYQYYQDFAEVTVAVGADRVAGIRQLLQQRPQTEVVVLDDALQHRPVRPHFSLLITDYGRLFTRDYMLPTGLLREHRSGVKRVQAVVVSKCPLQLDRLAMNRVKAEIEPFTRTGTPVFFSSYRYGSPIRIGAAAVCAKITVLLTGIANPRPLREYLETEGYEVVDHLSFPDHHAFTTQDLNRLQKVLTPYKGHEISVITTRKDAVRLLGAGTQAIVRRLPVFYIPIQVQFLREQDLFDQMILGVVRAAPTQHIH